MNEDDSPPRQPGPELDRLNAFVGTWKTRGVVHAEPSSPPVTYYATDTYEWLPGRYFLVHRWDAQMPDGQTQGIEIIGYDAAAGTYPMHSFDDQGNHTVMQASTDGDRWRFAGESVRFTGELRDAGKTFAGQWEQRSSDGSTWRHWMTVELTKIV